MEVNKDEALKCIDLAERYIASGTLDKAQKFILKAERLYPTDRSKELLKQLEDRMKSSNNVGNSGDKANKENVKPSASHSQDKEYTSEQLVQVQRIKKCKDYYEILGVEKNANDLEIKKAYKKLALQLHPDKNKAPGSSEAFKAIGNAVAILSDAEKRKQYDLVGNSDQNGTTRHRSTRQSHYEYTRGFEADLTAEELFNMFFGSNFASYNPIFMRRQTRWQSPSPEPQDMSGASILYQMLPILVLILFSLMSSIFVSEPIFTLTSHSRYPVRLFSERLNIPYYVKQQFKNPDIETKRELDMAAEQEYLTNLQYKCLKEQNYKENMKWSARYHSDQKMMDKAQNMHLPACEEYAKLTGKKVSI